MFYLLQLAIESVGGWAYALIIAELALLILIFAFFVSRVDGFLKKFGQLTSQVQTQENVQAVPPAPVIETPALPAHANQNLELIGLDEPTAAVIMAVVSHQTNIPLEKLDFKKISSVSE